MQNIKTFITSLIQVLKSPKVATLWVVTLVVSAVTASVLVFVGFYTYSLSKSNAAGARASQQEAEKKSSERIFNAGEAKKWVDMMDTLKKQFEATVPVMQPESKSGTVTTPTEVAKPADVQKASPDESQDKKRATESGVQDKQPAASNSKVEQKQILLQ